MKNKGFCFFIVLPIILLSSCKVTKSGDLKPEKLYSNFLRQNGVVNSAVKGYWKSIGSGYILNATTDGILLYSYTTNFCYKEKNDYIESLLNTQARFTLRNDTISIYPADYGDKSNLLQTKNDYVRIEKLPENCMSFSEMQQLDPKKLFSLFIETLRENYAFSKERNLNWDAIKTEFESKLSDTTSEKELFRIMGEVVTLTKDHHTKIIAENGQTLQFRGTPAAEIVSAAFKRQSKVEKLDDYFNLFFNTSYKNISDSLLEGHGKKECNGKIEWGSLNDKVGYISIYSFTNFTSGRVSRKQEIDSLNYHMEHIVKALLDKDAIILDISFNFGGFDAASLAIAGFFTDKLKLAYTSQVYNNGTFYDESRVYIQPADRINFKKPVYILMTDISRSAAEGFAMTMKVNPSVKLVGTNTLGILSGMLGKSIGNFYSTASNQRLITPNGIYYEVSGVEPDIKMPVFNTDNILNAHKEAVRKLVGIINGK